MKTIEYNLTEIEAFDATDDFKPYTKIKLTYKSSGLTLFLNDIVLDEEETLALSPSKNILTHTKIGKSMFVIKVELS